jgi:hypothetical protein
MSDSPRSRRACRTVVLPAGSTTAVVDHIHRQNPPCKLLLERGERPRSGNISVEIRRRRDGFGDTSISISRAAATRTRKQWLVRSRHASGPGRIRSGTFPSTRHVDYRLKDCPAFSIAVSTSLRAQPVNSTRLVASLANLIGNSPR